MLKNIDLDNCEKLRKEIFSFIWNFRHGDNIHYNLNIIGELYEARKLIGDDTFLRKPMVITIVSIIEAILIDLLVRIREGTNHLPKNIDLATINLIKDQMENDTKTRANKKRLAAAAASGQRIYLKHKSYGYSELVKIFKEHELFGSQTDQIYTDLTLFGILRNRVHIENYHQNLESKEEHAFTKERLQELEEILGALWEKMTTDFKRPW